VRVILRREVAGLGRPGDVKDVADGYAQNFLLPRGLAVEATAGEMKVLVRARDAKRAKEDRAHADAEELAKRLSETTLMFRLKAGDRGKTFGSVTSKDIVDALKREHKVDIDKTNVHLPEPLKTLGAHKVEIRLLTDVRPSVTVAIEAER
jgi:large subunit ribosomal protein L9